MTVWDVGAFPKLNDQFEATYAVVGVFCGLSPIDDSSRLILSEEYIEASGKSPTKVLNMKFWEAVKF